MSQEHDELRVRFYGAQDLSTYAQIQRIDEVLNGFDNRNPAGLNDLIELIQCYKVVENIQQSDYWAEPRKSQLMDLAMQAKNKALREIPRLLESHGIIDCVDETVIEYKEVLWGLIGSCGYHKSVKSEDVETLLKAHPEHVQMVLRTSEASRGVEGSDPGCSSGQSDSWGKDCPCRLCGERRAQ